MTGEKRAHVRIAIGDPYLDEVQIAQARSDVPGRLSLLSFPAHRHQARIVGPHVLVSTQAATAVKLYADGVLSPAGRGVVSVTVGDRPLGPCLLRAVETDGVDPFSATIVLHFRRAGEDGT